MTINCVQRGVVPEGRGSKGGICIHGQERSLSGQILEVCLVGWRDE